MDDEMYTGNDSINAHTHTYTHTHHDAIGNYSLFLLLAHFQACQVWKFLIFASQTTGLRSNSRLSEPTNLQLAIPAQVI
jgi:hypothetical protein